MPQRAGAKSSLNETQFTKAIKEAEVCHVATATALQAHMDSVLTLEHETKAEEGGNTKPS